MLSASMDVIQYFYGGRHVTLRINSKLKINASYCFRFPNISRKPVQMNYNQATTE
jgi:hypothetical protein